MQGWTTSRPEGGGHIYEIVFTVNMCPQNKLAKLRDIASHLKMGRGHIYGNNVYCKYAPPKKLTQQNWQIFVICFFSVTSINTFKFSSVSPEKGSSKFK